MICSVKSIDSFTRISAPEIEDRAVGYVTGFQIARDIQEVVRILSLSRATN
jgi:hypothetical protein